MDKIIVEQIKNLIVDSGSQEKNKKLRGVQYAEGYKAALADVQRIISLAETLSKKG